MYGIKPRSHFYMYKRAHNWRMDYQWDNNKAEANLRKHGIDWVYRLKYASQVLNSESSEAFEGL